MGTFGGKQPGAGRPKGSVNKLHRDVKENILDVFDELNPDGQLEHMRQWAQRDPAGFYAIYSKLLPKAVEGTISGDFVIRLVTGVPDSKNA